MTEPSPSPFLAAVGGLVLGSAAFLAKLQTRLDAHPPGSAVFQLDLLRQRPALSAIATAVAAYFGNAVSGWTEGSRCDDASRAVAVYLARRRFGYTAGETAAGLGYRSDGGVHNALRRIEAAFPSLTASIEELHRERRRS